MHDASEKQKRTPASQQIVVVCMPRQPLAKSGLGFLDRLAKPESGLAAAPLSSYRFVSDSDRAVNLEIVGVLSRWLRLMMKETV